MKKNRNGERDAGEDLGYIRQEHKFSFGCNTCWNKGINKNIEIEIGLKAGEKRIEAACHRHITHMEGHLKRKLTPEERTMVVEVAKEEIKKAKETLRILWMFEDRVAGYLERDQGDPENGPKRSPNGKREFLNRHTGPVYCGSLSVVQNLFSCSLFVGYGIGGNRVTNRVPCTSYACRNAPYRFSLDIPGHMLSAAIAYQVLPAREPADHREGKSCAGETPPVREPIVNIEGVA